jgi:hypothetical protein
MGGQWTEACACAAKKAAIIDIVVPLWVGTTGAADLDEGLPCP